MEEATSRYYDKSVLGWANSIGAVRSFSCGVRVTSKFSYILLIFMPFNNVFTDFVQQYSRTEEHF
jgi:hypothetical protein